MIHNNYTVLQLGLLLTLFTFNSACRNKCAADEKALLRDGVVEAIPYEDGQKTRYSTSDGDTIMVQTKRIYWTPSPDQNCEEYLELNMKVPGETYFFVESVQRGLSIDSMLQFSVSPTRENGVGTIVQFTISTEGQLGGLASPYYIWKLHPSLSIGSNSYQDVLEMNYSFTEGGSVKSFFYNKTEGIIQVSNQNGLVLTKIPD